VSGLALGVDETESRVGKATEQVGLGGTALKELRRGVKARVMWRWRVGKMPSSESVTAGHAAGFNNKGSRVDSGSGAWAGDKSCLPKHRLESCGLAFDPKIL